MAYLESNAKSPAEVHQICLTNCKPKNCAACSFVSWVPLVIAKRELERAETAYRVKLAERDDLFAKVGALRKYLKIEKSEESKLDKDFIITINSVNAKIDELFGVSGFYTSTECNAKTTRQVIDFSLGTEDWDLNGLGITKAKVDFEKPLWVPLEEAQKLEALKDSLIKSSGEVDEESRRFLIQRDELADKIKEAVSLLDELLTPNSAGCFTFPAPQRLQKIKAILSSEAVPKA